MNTRLLPNPTDKINLKTSDKYVSLTNLCMYYTVNIQKSNVRTINLKYQLQHGMKNLNYLMDHIPYQVFKIILILLKKHGARKVNLSIRISINEIENRITFKIKTGFYLKLLTPETMKLFGGTKSKIAENENDENIPNLEISEVVLVH